MEKNLAPNKKNLGVILEFKPSDYVAGADSKIAYKEVNPAGDWTDSLPTKESQFITDFDSSACVTFSALNCLETQLNYLMDAGKIPAEKLKKLKDWGYIIDGKFNFSDRFIAKLSGTTPQGNTLQNVWDAIKTYGLVPEAMWPTTTNGGWPEYYKEIPQQIKDFGLNFKTIFETQYEWIVTGNCGAPNLDYLKYHLKQSPLQPAHPLCVRDSQGTLQPCGSCVTQHATTIYNVNDLIRDFDHYYPYLNNYALGYTFPWIMKAVALLKTSEPEQPAFSHVFNVDIRYGQKGQEVIFLQQALNVLGYNIPISPDNGYFEKTRTAVLDFQRKYKVASSWELNKLNGKVVGPKTRKKLNELLKK